MAKQTPDELAGQLPRVTSQNMRGKPDRGLDLAQILITAGQRVIIANQRVWICSFQLGLQPIEVEQQLPQFRRPATFLQVPKTLRKPAPPPQRRG